MLSSRYYFVSFFGFAGFSVGGGRGATRSQ